MIKIVVQSLRTFLALSLIVGLLYPLSVTLIGQTLWSHQANGSLVERNQKIVGSELLAQKSESMRLFWPRPSASDYGSIPSGASNQGPTSEALKASVQERRAKGFANEMLFASGSGLDPHITKDAAISQLPRIVQARNMNDNQKTALEEIIKSSIEKRDLGFLGEERINVLRLNLKLVDVFGR
jgi:K+-transporting ATPase ATPase C chain